MDTKKFKFLLLVVTLFFFACDSNERDMSEQTRGSGNDTMHSKRDNTQVDDMNDSGTHGRMGGNMMDMNSRMKTMMDEMHTYTMTGDADFDFANMMIHHHQAAIDMSLAIKSNGKDVKTKEIADKIISEQQKEIGEMEDWLKNRGSSPEVMREQGEYKKEMDGMMNTMMGRMNHRMTGDMDRDYAEMMIMHHDDAMKMANIEIKYGKDEKMKNIANRIKENNKKETEELNSILSERK